MNDIGMEFWEKTKYSLPVRSRQMAGMPQPPLELDFDRSKKVFELPQPGEIEVNTLDVRKAIELRRSIRSYSGQSLAIDELAYLLWCTQGVQKVVMDSATLRNVPSAGARHALETFLLLNNVDGMNPGIYRYLALEHMLTEINLQPELADRVTEACFGQKMVKACPAVFIWVAVICRMNWRYASRGYRYILLDAGHVCQNLYLAAESLGCGVCAIGAYSDDGINKILNLDGREHFVVYMAALGKK